MDFDKLIELGKKIYPYHENDFRSKNIVKFHLDVFNARTAETIKQCGNFKISDCEIFAFFMLIGFASYEIQNPLRNIGNKPDAFIKQIICELDSFLLKIPRTKAKKLYRQDKFLNIESFAEGRKVSFNSFLNTSIDNYNNTDNIIWVIKPLESESKGHEVYLIYNHGNEKQITFERGADFHIDKIEKYKDVSYIYCHEKETTINMERVKR